MKLKYRGLLLVAAILAISPLISCTSLLASPQWLENLRQAQKAILAGNEQKADELLEMALGEAGKHRGCPQPVVRYQYSHTFAGDLQLVARAYRAQGKVDKAEKLFQTALAMNEKCRSPDYQLDSCLEDLANIYRLDGRSGEAKELYDRILRRARGRDFDLATKILLLYAGDLVSKKDLSAAEQLYREACTYEERGRTIAARMELAQFYKVNGRYKEGEDIYLKLLLTKDKHAGSSTYVLYKLGELYRSQARYSEAEKSYKDVIADCERWDSYRLLSLSGLAELDDAQGKYDRACSHYAQAAQAASSNNTEFLTRYAAFLRRHKRQDDASKVESQLRSAAAEIEHAQRFAGVYFNP